MTASVYHMIHHVTHCHTSLKVATLQMYVPEALAATFFVLWLLGPLEAIFFPFVPVFLPLAVGSLAFEAFALLCLAPPDTVTVRFLRQYTIVSDVSGSTGPAVALSRD